MRRRAVFLDRDGTIIQDEGYLADAARVRLLDGAAEALRGFQAEGLLLVVVSNQSGVARGLITPRQHAEVHARVDALLAGEGVKLDAAYYCLHAPGAGCGCRKPKPGMLRRAAREHDIDLPASLMIGDKPSDVAAGRAAGCTTALLGAAQLVGPAERPDLRGADWPALRSSMEAQWKA